MLLAFVLFAEEAGKPDQPGWAPFLPLLVILPLLYILMIRPMRRQEQERQTMVTSLRKNDKVLTNAGIYGTVVSVSEKEDEVVVRVDDNVRLRMIKSSITRNISREEEARAAKEQKTGGA